MIQHSEAYQQLLAAIEADPDDQDRKRILADWLDEHDEPDLADAYRWCASEGKWPEWNHGDRGEYDWWGKSSIISRANLGIRLFAKLKGFIDIGSYKSAHDAVADLARVLKMQATVKVLADVSFDGDRREEHWAEIEVPQGTVPQSTARAS